MSIEIEKSIGFALHHSSYLLKAAIKTAFNNAKLDITNEEFIVLFLTPVEGIEQSDLILKTKKDKTNLARLVARLVDKRYLKRQSSSNRRHQSLFLTKSGQKLQQQVAPVIQKLIANAIQNISQKDLEITRLTLNKLSHNISK